MTKQLFFAGLAGVISLLSLLAETGIGQAYNLYPITMVVVYAAFLVFPMGRALGSGYAPTREFFLTLGVALVIGLWPATQGYKTQGFEFAWRLALPYVIGMLALSRRDIRTIGFICGLFGLTVVVARLYFGVFENWNRNSIAMAGFLGCAVCSAAPWESWGGKMLHKILLVVMTLMILQLESRSCIAGMVILVVFAFGILKRDIFVRKNWVRRLILLFPILVAVGTVLFQNSQLFDSLNEWSMQYFSKPIFNGRNTIWEHGMEVIGQNPILGTGKIENGYWHNCAITCMAAFGAVGYGLWLLYFENTMSDACQWPEDPCLICCIVAFLTIMIQQSFELGLVSTGGSMLPYLIVGMMLGRIRYLQKQH